MPEDYAKPPVTGGKIPLKVKKDTLGKWSIWVFLSGYAVIIVLLMMIDLLETGGILDFFAFLSRYLIIFCWAVGFILSIVCLVSDQKKGLGRITFFLSCLTFWFVWIILNANWPD